jgi:hypothetical protein
MDSRILGLDEEKKIVDTLVALWWRSRVHVHVQGTDS